MHTDCMQDIEFNELFPFKYSHCLVLLPKLVHKYLLLDKMKVIIFD